MAFVVADRVKETCTTTGTGALTLLGAAPDYQSFAAIGDGNTTYYSVVGRGTGQWECGITTYTASGASLARTAGNVLGGSSGAGVLVSFSAGTKDAFNDLLAAGLGAGIPAWLRAPSSANLFAAQTDKTGSGGALVFATGPTTSDQTITGTLSINTPSAALITQMGLAANAGGTAISKASPITIGAENSATATATAGAGMVLYSNPASALSSGNRLGFILFGGASSATSLRNAAGITAFAEENWVDGSAYGAGFRFETITAGGTARTEKARLDNAGNFGLKATSFGTSAVGVFAVGNGTPPASSPASMIQTYAESGIYKVRDVNGNIGSLGVVARGRFTAQTAAVASIAAYTVGAADASFMVSGNALVTSVGTYSFGLEIDYTDESNTARTYVMPFTGQSGNTVPNMTGGTSAYAAALPTHIRCKAGTTITVKTVGTFTTVTYNVEVNISQVG